MLPILGAVVFPWRQAWRPRLQLLGGAAAAALAAFVLLVLPEREFAKADPDGGLFLPETLLTVHATVIRDQLLADVRTGAATPFPADWLATAADLLDREVRRAAEPAQKPYPTLGINPDHLMYSGDSFCHWLYANGTRRQIADFCYFYYERAWTRHPAPMLANVCRQLSVFYTWRCPAFWVAEKLKVERYYRKTGEAFSPLAYQGQLTAYAPGSDYLAAASRLSMSDTVFRLSSLMIGLNNTAAWSFLPLSILFLAGMFAVKFLPPAHRRRLWVPGSVLLLTNIVLFGNCLTVAVVHSFDVERYSYNLLLYAAWGELAAAVWLLELVGEWLAGRLAPKIVSAPGSVVVPFAGLPPADSSVTCLSRTLSSHLLRCT